MSAAGKAAIALMTSVIAVAAAAFAPAANAEMQIGNYEVLNNRWTDHMWVWAVWAKCSGDQNCGTPDEDPAMALTIRTLDVLAIPTLSKSQWFRQDAFYSDSRYTLTVDVPDGVRCIGFNLPSHDVYSWDAKTLAGTIVSTYDAGCYGAQGGTATYPFSLKRY